MTQILIINGPNLNNLGKRDSGHYGSITLDEINAAISEKGSEIGVETSFFQSNHEGSIVDHIQAESSGADGVIINGGALTQVGYSILDALLDTGLPVVEVHISNIRFTISKEEQELILKLKLWLICKKNIQTLLQLKKRLGI